MNQDNETAKETAEELIVKQQYYLRQKMLHRILEKFGRKNELTLRLFDDVCSYIRSKNDKIVHVFPSYKIHSDREVVFVIFVKDLLSKKEEDEIGYTIKQRLVDQFSPEGKDVMTNETTSDEALTLDETKRLKDCINMHATDLMQRHKYLSIITASPVRSKSYGTHDFKIQKEPCIVLYVHTKGYIPLDEDPFERRYVGVPVDVREGMFVTCPGSSVPKAKEYHEPLRMGCDIAGKSKKQSGTLGGFIEHPQYGICGLTCAHVLLNFEYFKKLIEKEDRRMHWPEFNPCEAVYQPGDSDHQIGQLVQAVYQEGGKDFIGVEVALFQIEQRPPAEGEFPSTLNGADGEELRFNSGKTYGLSRINKWPVVKFGRTTDKTSGIFVSTLPLVSARTMKYIWDDGECSITLHNQFEIQSVESNKKFADFGDSGSLVFMKDETGEYVCVGMVDGVTSYGITIVTPITPILDQFKVFRLKSFQEKIFERYVTNTLQIILDKLS
ncbi:uncharacterized protein LOC123538739 [Mercenaria mercenaria]|uniref:uncharacterized protein LOC123538739 n=1 Tax=Mercenaria mercenaria TaxID=6596 RepID=UPI00234E6E82|nr:uncharacterized protein LOC123538739 [Mercenaria mercenaria]